MFPAVTGGGGALKMQNAKMPDDLRRTFEVRFGELADTNDDNNVVPVTPQHCRVFHLSARCKRKAEEEDAPPFFDEVCRQSSPDAAQSLSFAGIETAI